MRLFMVFAILVFAMPMTGFCWAEGTSFLLDPHLVCKKTRRLRGKLAEICRSHDSALLREIISGINLGFRECEFQFRHRRWNCTALRKSMRKILMRDSRETGFVNAITSAGVTYAVTRACTTGNLMECSCDKSHTRRLASPPLMTNAATTVAALQRHPTSGSTTIVGATVGNNSNSNNTNANGRGGRGGGGRGRGSKIVTNNGQRKLLRNIQFPEGEWEWGGCSDNVNFGFRYSRAFLDAKHRRRSDLRSLVKLHNNNAGRLAIRDSMRLECKCHGLSGSCTVKTCWLKMPPFREVGARLRAKSDAANKMVLRNDGNSFMPDPSATPAPWTATAVKQPNKYDLIYSDDSPDFCAANSRTGSMGTQDRECNATSTGPEGCDRLCCGRGHKHRAVSEWVNCKCVFKWCCEVSCDKCLERRELNTCL